MYYFCHCLFPNNVFSKSWKKAAELKNQVNSKAYITENYTKLQTSISNISASINITKGVEENKFLLAASLDNLSKYVPTNIKFINLNYQNGSFAITGSSSNYNSCTEFIANLETSKEFPTAVINNITYKKDTKTYDFSINIPQKEVENNEQTK